MMVEIAQTYTGFQSDERNKIVVNDGRRHLQKTGGKWDWILLDAYVRRSQVPPQFTTVEFYKLVASRLSDNGVFVDNIHAGTALFQSNVKTLVASFRKWCSSRFLTPAISSRWRSPTRRRAWCSRSGTRT